MSVMLNPPIRIFLGMLLALTTVSSSAGDAVEELLSSARLWEANKREDLARTALEKALLISPLHPQAMLMLGLMELKSERIEQVGQRLKQLQSAHPGDPAARQLEDAYRIATTDRKAMARARLLARTGKNEEAMAAMRDLYPKGPPGGELGTEYYRLLASTEKNRKEAMAGLERLIRESADDLRPRLALADLLIDQSASRLQGIRLAASLARQDELNHQEVLGVWRRGLNKLDLDPANESLYRDYLAQDPLDQLIQQRLKEVADPSLKARRAAAGKGRKSAGPDSWDLIKAAKKAQERGRLQEAENLALKALKLRPGELEAMITLAGIHVDKRDQAKAEALYRQVLRRDHANDRALRGMIKLLSESGRRSAAIDFLEAFAGANPSKAGAVASMRAGLLRAEADDFLNSGQMAKAVETLEKGLRLAPVDPWLRFDLARLYVRQGLVQPARKLMEQDPAAVDPQAIYAQALFLAGIDDEAAALVALERIAPARRNESMTGLYRRTQVRLRAKQARDAQMQGDQAVVSRLLQEAEKIAESEPELLWSVAGARVERGEVERGLALGRRLLAEGSPGTESRLHYARLLNAAERDDELADMLEQTEPDQLPAHRQADWLSLRASLAIRRARVKQGLGEYGQALELLNSALRLQPNDGRLLAAQAELYDVMGRRKEARAILRRVIESNPADYDARLSKAKLDRRMGNAGEALRELNVLRSLAPEDDVDTRLGIARQLVALERYDEARQVTEMLNQRRPNDAKVLLQSGRVEKEASDYDQALVLFRQARKLEIPDAQRSGATAGQTGGLSPATEEIQSIERRRYGFLSAGFDQRQLSGTPGLSEITDEEYPLLFRYPLGYRGHWFIQMDYSTVSAGQLPLYRFDDAGLFGKIQALGQNHLKGVSDQSASGVDFGIGYQNDDWRFDIGSSPQGFPVSYLVGGIKKKGSIGDAYYSLDLARRPVPNSLISYAGARDPVTGDVWGGVRRNGLDFYSGYDDGRLGLFLQGGAHYLDGEHVKSNRDLMLRGGADWAFIDTHDMRLTAGFALMYWNFANNQRFYTFGHGGYWSPQDYQSIAFPLQWSGRFGALSYLLRGSYSFSVSQEKDADFYPNDSGLQAMAEKNPLPSGYSRPVYGGSDGSGTGYSIMGILEYQVDPHLFLGARYELARSPYYTPNYMTFYFRYAFEPRTEEIPFPPKPIRPYYTY
ncbi:MAG: cellulose synthase subunit BcsC-related outer membrane protein [Methylococcaceae bacterium]|nr:cellulose synthase subunit BcsC-related outer membrane protein [Methylococcaceae bacterium]